MGILDGSRRRQEKDIQREVKYKQGIIRVRGFIHRSRESQKQLWDLGKRALKLGDQRQFHNIARSYLRTGEIVSRWERYLVAAETINLQRGQVKAAGEFVQSIHALSESMMAGARPEEVVKMQVELEQALARAQNIDETLGAVMDSSADTVFSSEGLSEESLKEIRDAMSAEAAHEESSTVQDERIAQGIKAIEEAMRREIK
ncbi:MAG: hypothetical protein HY673_20600 [Chloroflexi bacterium]|nr:hypothetical protein [Chloroflexota bacterium]